RVVGRSRLPVCVMAGVRATSRGATAVLKEASARPRDQGGGGRIIRRGSKPWHVVALSTRPSRSVHNGEHPQSIVTTEAQGDRTGDRCRELQPPEAAARVGLRETAPVPKSVEVD